MTTANTAATGEGTALRKHALAHGHGTPAHVIKGMHRVIGDGAGTVSIYDDKGVCLFTGNSDNGTDFAVQHNLNVYFSKAAA